MAVILYKERRMAESMQKPNRSYTFEDVWAALMKQEERQEKDALRMQEMDRFMKRLR
jgi:hypothetical protein